MIIAALTISLLAQPAESITPGQLISKMLAKYDASKASQGTITLTQSFQTTTLTVTTKFAFRGDAMISVQQNSSSTSGGQGRKAFIVADGNVLTYSKPKDADLGKVTQLYEKVDQNGVKMKVRDLYSIGTAGLIDRSPLLDIAFARRSDLQFFVSQLHTVKFLDDGSSSTRLLGGEWKPYALAPVAGRWEMRVTSDGDVKSFQIREQLVAQPDGNAAKISGEVVSSWASDIQVNSEADLSLFKVPRS